MANTTDLIASGSLFLFTRDVLTQRPVTHPAQHVPEHPLSRLHQPPPDHRIRTDTFITTHAGGHDRLSARPPTTEELEGLELPDDVPVIRQFRVIYSDDDRAVEVSILIKGAHRYELQYHDTVAPPSNG